MISLTYKDIFTRSWTDIKAIAVAKVLELQYEDTPEQYLIWLTEDSIKYQAFIWKAGYEPSGINVSQNTADRTDFETNYQAIINKKIVQSVDLYSIGVASGNRLKVESVLSDGTNNIDVLDDTGIYRLRVEAKIAAGGAPQDVHLVDDADVNMDVVEDVLLPGGTRALIFAGKDQDGYVRFPTVSVDGSDSKRRVEVAGKFSLGNPSPPVSSNPVTIAADTPLDVSSTHDTDYAITDGDLFTLTQVFAGSEGDPNEKGSVVELFYIDASSVSHVIERVYITGFTRDIYPDTSVARDGTSMVGTAAGGTGLVRIRRRRLGGAAIEIDAVARGYEETP